MNHYELIDSGHGRKLERFGRYIIDRPSLSAIWAPTHKKEWEKAEAVFTREGQNHWKGLHHLPKEWVIEVSGIKFKLMPTDFGHLGVFPEQKPHWKWIQEILREEKRSLQVLNLFAYSGGSTMAAAMGGAAVCHLDASKGMCAWARDNAILNHLEKAPIRWIVEDVQKFLKREITRGKQYDAIILDPPSFGRGAKGEIFKIEEHLIPLLEQCRQLLTKKPLFVLFSCHTPGLTPVAMHHLLSEMMRDYKGLIESGEMLLEGKTNAVLSVPSGTFAKWTRLK